MERLRRRQQAAIDRYMRSIDRREWLATAGTRTRAALGRLVKWMVGGFAVVKERVHDRSARGNRVPARAAGPTREPEIVTLDTGITHIHAGDLDAGVARLHEAIAMEPGWVMPLYLLAGTYHDMGDEDNAERYCQQALEADPGLDIARSLLDDIRSSRGRANGAA